MMKMKNNEIRLADRKNRVLYQTPTGPRNSPTNKIQWSDLKNDRSTISAKNQHLENFLLA